MAKKIAVLDCHATNPNNPITYVKKSVASMLVRRLLADWFVYGLSIRQRGVNPSCGISAANFNTLSHYIPETLPPSELPGVTCTTDQGLEKRSLLIRARLFANSCQ